MTQSSNSFSRRLPHRAAFSLMELLTVISIIAIMSVLGVAMFNNVGKGNSVRGAMDVAASLALAARLEAMSTGLGAKLVIDNDTGSKYKLRRMAILRAEGADPSSSVYKLNGNPVLLPEGVYFLSSESDPVHGSSNSGLPDENFVFTGTEPTNCIVYQFDGSGHLINPGRMVFVAGIMGSNGLLTLTDTKLAGRLGFRIPVNGRPAFYQSPDQIK